MSLKSFSMRIWLSNSMSSRFNRCFLTWIGTVQERSAIRSSLTTSMRLIGSIRESKGDFSFRNAPTNYARIAKNKTRSSSTSNSKKTNPESGLSQIKWSLACWKPGSKTSSRQMISWFRSFSTMKIWLSGMRAISRILRRGTRISIRCIWSWSRPIRI